MPGKKKKSGLPSDKASKFHEELTGFDIKINPFGEMESNFSIDQLNAFLNHQVVDKKLNPGEEEE